MTAASIGVDYLFQSTLPSRGATVTIGSVQSLQRISIHAPLAGSDMDSSFGQTCNLTNFNPRSPRGERQVLADIYLLIRKFQSTLPSRGATAWEGNPMAGTAISIHAPLAGSDILQEGSYSGCIYFNPRSPRGERRLKYRINTERKVFQSTLPSRGATATLCSREIFLERFQSTLPSRGATGSGSVMRHSGGISIHAPLAGSDGDSGSTPKCSD